MDNLWEEVGGIILAVILIWGGTALYHHYVGNTHIEISGTAKYEDCRQQIYLDDDEYMKEGGEFICNDQKTQKGYSLGGLCVKTVNGDSGACLTAYFHTKKPADVCGSNSYLTSDDKCTCNLGYASDGTTCIEQNQLCKNTYGIGSHADKSATFDNNFTCGCNTGYYWNSDQTKCI